MTDTKTVDVPLHELPRDVRLWLCQRLGWKTPLHFGIVRLVPESKTMTELRERLKGRKTLV